MKKVKIRKKLPKGKVKFKLNKNFKKPAPEQDKFKDSYLQFYDDIKVPSRRYDW